MRGSGDQLEQRLLNVVDEMAIASGVPAPKVYLLDAEPGINAFAAGFTTQQAVVAVTRGTLEQLTRDELQGVVAHEFSHILNGDMRLNLRLIGILHGILLLALLGRVILEHTSANPNGPLHVGRARNPIIGDTLARIMRKAGWTVETQYYLDDIGKQVAILAWGQAHLQEADLPPAERDKVDHRLVRYYQVANQRREQEAAKGVETEIGELMRRSEEADPEVVRMFERAYGDILQGMLESLETIGVRFDSFKKESDFIANGETVPYDYLVIALGARPNVAMAPGAAEHALTFKGAGDALRIRNHVIDLFEAAAPPKLFWEAVGAPHIGAFTSPAMRQQLGEALDAGAA